VNHRKRRLDQQATSSGRGQTGAAFTLVELLLTVALMLLLAGAVISNFGQMDQNARLEEGTTQLETLFRFARAQAANTGRQVQIVFDGGMTNGGASATMTTNNQSMSSTNTGIQALWEPDPINFPGQWQPLPGAALLVEHVNDLVQVLLSRQPSASANQTNGTLTDAMLLQLQTNGTNAMPAEDGTTATIPPVVCYPDGSSDSVGLVLGAVDREDKRLMVLALSGLTGSMHHRVVNFASDGTIMVDTTNAPTDLSASATPNL